jgi:hypothetical protein
MLLTLFAYLGSQHEPPCTAELFLKEKLYEFVFKTLRKVELKKCHFRELTQSSRDRMEYVMRENGHLAG